MLREELEKILKEQGLKIGCYHLDDVELTKSQKKRLLDKIKQGCDDTDIKFKGFVIEIWHVDNEVDFIHLTSQEYLRYS